MSHQHHATLNGTEVSDVRIPLVGLGTWPLTGADCTKAVSQALESGYRHIDTAQNYANEDAVGQAIRESGLGRDEVFLTTKFNKESHGGESAVRQAAERALDRMGLDHLDLFLVHWPNPDQGLYVETCNSLAELVGTGLIRAWGVSNFKPGHLHKILSAGLVPPINQVQVDPLHAQRDHERANTEAGVVTAAYSPLGRGGELLQSAELSEPAERLGRTPAQIALRWHVQQNRIVLPRSANTDRQRQNLDVFDFELTKADMERIDSMDTGKGARLDADTFGH
ncbi:aldo/keto reductase [Citricoccus nitrophenolicus]|uniref:aldo/keto reductase n=1 Tax=Citricoccus nitrophenolicus TaxID=863575 RepID=UPI0039B4DDB4